MVKEIGRKGKGTNLSWRDKELPLDRKKTGMIQRKMAVYKGTRGNPMLG